MICGFLGCASAEGNPVISTLPSLLKLNVEQGGAAEWIRSTFQYAAEEISAGRPGSETVLAKLSELLFMETVRRYAEALLDGQDRMARRFARASRCAGTGAITPRRHPALDRGCAWSRGRTIAFGVGRPLHSPDRRAADALPRQLAHAGRESEDSATRNAAGQQVSLCQSIVVHKITCETSAFRLRCPARRRCRKSRRTYLEDSGHTPSECG
jgi:Cupin